MSSSDTDLTASPALAAARLRGTLALLAVAAMVAAQAWSGPLHLPGHRGLIWLTALVAMALAGDGRGWATGVALGSGALVLAGGLASSPLIGVSYVLAGLALDGLVRAAPRVCDSLPAVAVAAALVHLVDLIGPVAAGGRHAGAGPGGGPLALLAGHVLFGLAAGALGFSLARRGARG